MGHTNFQCVIVSVFGPTEMFEMKTFHVPKCSTGKLSRDFNVQFVAQMFTQVNVSTVEVCCEDIYTVSIQ